MPLTNWDQKQIDAATEAFWEFAAAISSAKHRNRFRTAKRVLGIYAGMKEQEVAIDPAKALRRARAATHPDRGGSRVDWDRIEKSARVLGLI